MKRFSLTSRHFVKPNTVRRVIGSIVCALVALILGPGVVATGPNLDTLPQQVVQVVFLLWACYAMNRNSQPFDFSKRFEDGEVDFELMKIIVPCLAALTAFKMLGLGCGFIPQHCGNGLLNAWPQLSTWANCCVSLFWTYFLLWISEQAGQFSLLGVLNAERQFGQNNVHSQFRGLNLG